MIIGISNTELDAEDKITGFIFRFSLSYLFLYRRYSNASLLRPAILVVHRYNPIGRMKHSYLNLTF